MTHVINKLAKFIMLAMAVNFAVACLCVLFCRPHTGSHERDPITPDDVFHLHHGRLSKSDRYVQRVHAQAFGYDYFSLHVDRGTSHAADTSLIRISAGVPWKSFVGEYRADISWRGSPDDVDQWRGLLNPRIDLKPFISMEALPIPLYPLPAGMVGNTCLYGVLLWVMFRAAAVARRHVRVRRGQCPACRYPAGLSPACTECGAPLPIENVQQPSA